MTPISNIPMRAGICGYTCPKQGQMLIKLELVRAQGERLVMFGSTFAQHDTISNIPMSAGICGWTCTEMVRGSFS
jgi:hypothetical protein